MFWSNLYGLIALAVVIVALWSNASTTTKMALMLMLCWTGSAVADATFHNLHKSSLVVPSIDAAIGLFVGWIGLREKSYLALAVFVLFVLQGYVHVVALSNHLEASRIYIEVSNAIFAIQLFIVGSTGIEQGLVREHDRSLRRAHITPAGG